MAQPSPDWNLVTLKWAGTYLDGTPCAGSLTLNYNGGVMLDDSATTPINIYPSKLVVPLTTTTVPIDGVPTQVGYAEFQVPASNDPDIQGAGGTYTLTETLNKGGGRVNASFVADLNAPGGVIWLNKVIPTTPFPGTTLSVVYYSDFQALTKRVDDLEARPAGTGTGGGVAAVTVDNIPAGSMLAVRKNGTTWPARPTNRADVVVAWIGADPSPAIVPTGTGGMLDNVDIRFVSP